jgi:hypothetical protein
MAAKERKNHKGRQNHPGEIIEEEPSAGLVPP